MLFRAKRVIEWYWNYLPDILPKVCEEGQTPLVVSCMLESFLFSVGIFRSSHDCVYLSCLQGGPLFEESKDSVFQMDTLFPGAVGSSISAFC